jgi:hypothetical protein
MSPWAGITARAADERHVSGNEQATGPSGTVDARRSFLVLQGLCEISIMASVLVAIYEDFGTAENVRTELVGDGFPTDRVELTSLKEPGQAGNMPGASPLERFHKYFETLFEQDGDDIGHFGDSFARHIADGGTAITVHPRGELEIDRATQILQRHRPVELEWQGLDETTYEHAASKKEGTVVGRVLRGTTR